MATSSPALMLSLSLLSVSMYSRLTVSAQLFSTFCLMPGYRSSSKSKSPTGLLGDANASDVFFVKLAAVAKYSSVKLWLLLLMVHVNVL